MNDYLYADIDIASQDEIEAFDIASLGQGFYENPYPVFHALRRYSPVHRMPSGAWFLTRYADVDTVYHDTEMFSSDKTVDFKKTMGRTSLYEHHTTRACESASPRHSLHVRFEPWKGG